MKRNSIFRFAETGGNMLCQAANDGGYGNSGGSGENGNNSSAYGTHKKHQKWNSDLNAWVWCMFCRDPEFYTPPAEPEDSEGYYNSGYYGGYCKCKCRGCRPVPPDEIITASDLAEKFQYKNDQDGQLYDSLVEIGESKWGGRVLDDFDRYPVNLNIIYDEDLDKIGETERPGEFAKNEAGEPMEKDGYTNIINITIGKDGLGDFLTMGHELYHGIDVATTFNGKEATEFGARMAEVILVNNESAARQSSNRDSNVEKAAGELLEEFVDKGWDKEKVSNEKFIKLRDAIYNIQIPVEGLDENGQQRYKSAYPEMENFTLDEFNPITIKKMYEDYNTPTTGNGMYYDQNSHYYDQVYYDGYYDKPCECNCECPDCECSHVEKEDESGGGDGKKDN